jgi:hypothetical protein
MVPEVGKPYTETNGIVVTALSIPADKVVWTALDVPSPGDL